MCVGKMPGAIGLMGSNNPLKFSGINLAKKVFGKKKSAAGQSAATPQTGTFG